MRTALGAVLAAVCALGLAACGGDGDGGGGSSGGVDEKAAREVSSQFVLTVFGVLAGTKQPQAMIDAYAPECRAGVKASDVAALVGLVRLFAPQLAEAKIEAVDLGELRIEPVADGFRVSLVDPDKLRLKVNGKFVDADEYFASLGLDNADDASPTGDEPILLVRREGKLYVGDCDSLQEFADPLGGSSGATPSSTVGAGRSGTPAPPREGASRTSPVRLGQAVVIKGTWQLTVLRVDRDAAAALQAASRSFRAPAAGEKLVLITVRAKNVSTEQKPASINDFNFRLTGSKNELYSAYSQKSSCGFSAPDEIDADLFPNGQTEGNLCFKVPADETGLLLVWEPDLSSDLTYLALE